MTLRQLWEEGRTTLGGWCVIPSPFVAELMARSGFDWICIDIQHGLIGYEQMVNMLQAIAITGTPSLVRVPWNQPDWIMRALDAGAEGIVIPMVNSVEEAQRAVGACRYPPHGYRSWGPVRAALGVPGYSPESANRRTVVVIMIETPGGVQAAEKIAAVPGVDAVYIGPNDLAVGHGLQPSGTVEEPEHERLVESILATCKRRGLVAGIHCGSVKTALRWRERGFTMLNVTSDAVFLRERAASVLEALRGQQPATPQTSGYA